jgi:hypothetical protein
MPHSLKGRGDEELDSLDPDSSSDESPDIDPHKVASRADGRPPEEGSSDDPEAQSEAILEESEQRTAEGASKSTPTGED